MTPTLPSLSRRIFLRGSAHVVVLSGIGASLLSACGGSNETDSVPETPRLANVENFRDMAGMGDGYPTADGRRLRRGVIYRSGALTADASDLVALQRLSLSAVHDLRTPTEVTLAADTLPDGVTRDTHAIAPIDAALAAPRDADAASAWMIQRQRQMIGDAVARAQFGALLTRVARVAGPQVVHGATGKDRTGWAAALLLAIADMPLDVIIQDYLATNVAAQAQIAARVSAHAARAGVTSQTIAPLYQAQSATIEAAFDEMQNKFVTLNDYLSKGLSLAQSDIDMLRAKLVA
ncbi:Protein tyrosine phosphatase [Candidatus Burkholderia verschuerenii]|uniref:Protein tyrosine phosphatase n=1 Tax=Candidatus Burkholderia verschuerenii TaxID=242163 RepID=A0A0L0MDI1_9BURK|nr:tyrosine-protein phosphatase [Candidatus Burkholderia verschuerenii]KND60351.1 Protein tyrosine phosphatase [Candidatus Burkholderia verschuerenii]